MLVQLIVGLSVLIVVLRLGLSTALLPHHGLFVVLPAVETGALVHADATHHFTARRNERQEGKQ